MIQDFGRRTATVPRRDRGSTETAPRSIAFLRPLAATLFVAALMTILVTSDIQALVHLPGLYDHAIEQHGAEEASGIDDQQLLRAAQQLRHYLTDGQRLDQITVDSNGATFQLFNAREQTHLQEVKARLNVVGWLLIAASVYAVAYIVVAVRPSPRREALARLGRQAGAGGLAMLALIAVGALGLASGFDQFWDRFHEVLFSNDLWLLDPSRDHLIQMFPEPFWQHLVTFLTGFMVLQSLGLVLIGALLHRYGKRGPLQQ